MKLGYIRLKEKGCIERKDILDFLNKKGFEEIISVWFSKEYNFIFFEININNKLTLYKKFVSMFNFDINELKSRYNFIRKVDEDYFLSFKENETNEIINIIKNEKEQEELKEIINQDVDKSLITTKNKRGRL